MPQTFQQQCNVFSAWADKDIRARYLHLQRRRTGQLPPIDKPLDFYTGMTEPEEKVKGRKREAAAKKTTESPFTYGDLTYHRKAESSRIGSHLCPEPEPLPFGIGTSQNLGSGSEPRERLHSGLSTSESRRASKALERPNPLLGEQVGSSGRVAKPIGKRLGASRPAAAEMGALLQMK
eukprot:NODE_5529_length_937_cov_51.705160_g5307_i0.p1 GENE.NODE_5529_length_937_cov_51.705160_g5307_i0~~NODE_5529_length_937_cov_51.705160_g5307_i0.p1  ORF type:complete len:178 (+),score=14.87 NODE_5529_length_937_cov_51.705160_g5307_i0:74-607(+)